MPMFANPSSLQKGMRVKVVNLDRKFENDPMIGMKKLSVDPRTLMARTHGAMGTVVGFDSFFRGVVFVQHDRGSANGNMVAAYNWQELDLDR